MPERSLINTGLIDSGFRPRDWVAGGVSGLPDDIVLETGDWRPYISEPHEMQLRYGVDFGLCTKFAATDAIEALMYKLFGTRINYSERALAIMAGQKSTNGDSLYNVAETIRVKGLVLEEEFPWTKNLDTWNKFIHPEKVEDIERMNELGKQWLKKYDFGYEWVWDDFGPGMREALKRSPLFAAGLYAYESSHDDEMIYHTDIPESPRTTHAFVLLNQTVKGYKDIDDSYTVQLKRLNTDFRVPIGMRFWIAKKNQDQPMYYPPKNSLVVVPETGERMMYVDGDNIFKDDAGKILLEVTARNAAGDWSQLFPVVHVHASDIAHLKRINLKQEPV